MEREERLKEIWNKGRRLALIAEKEGNGEIVCYMRGDGSGMDD